MRDAAIASLKMYKKAISCQLCPVRQVCQAEKCLYIAGFPQKNEKNNCQLDGIISLPFHCKLRIMTGSCSAERISQVVFIWTDFVSRPNWQLLITLLIISE